MVRYIHEVHIESQMDLEQEMCRYNCKTKEELDDFLWYNYGIVLILDYEENETEYSLHKRDRGI